jgi:predicted nucleic acid-binding protein
MTYVVDTCVLIWYLTNDPTLSNEAPDVLRLLDDASSGLETIYVPSIIIVELIYLMEKHKLTSDMVDKLLDQLTDPGSTFVISDLTGEVSLALANVRHNRGDKLDMPDRIIASDAYHRGGYLFTRDGKLNDSNIQILWR